MHEKVKNDCLQTEKVQETNDIYSLHVITAKRKGIVLQARAFRLMLIIIAFSYSFGVALCDFNWNGFHEVGQASRIFSLTFILLLIANNGRRQHGIQMFLLAAWHKRQKRFSAHVRDFIENDECFILLLFVFISHLTAYH